MAEKDWIARYFAPLAQGQGAAGLKDDVAQLGTSGPVAITTDAMVEGVHFLASDPVDTVARKLVRANVSDLLASGAEPAEALLTLGWPKARGEAEIAAFAAALGDELAAWGAQLIGGDTVTNPEGLFLSLTLTGRYLSDAPVRRTGAKTGDFVWLTGCVGGAARGWQEVSEGVAGGRWDQAYRLPALPPLATAGLVARHASAEAVVAAGRVPGEAMGGRGDLAGADDETRAHHASPDRHEHDALEGLLGKLALADETAIPAGAGDAAGRHHQHGHGDDETQRPALHAAAPSRSRRR